MSWDSHYSKLPDNIKQEILKKDCPKLNDRQTIVLEMFYELSSQRSSGFSHVNPISYSDLKAYLDLKGFSQDMPKYYIINIIRRVDNYYLQLTAPKG